MKQLKYVLLILFTCLSIFTYSTVKASGTELINSKNTYYDYFSTVIYITVWYERELDQSAWNEIEQILIDIEKTFSRTDENSELYKLNKKAGSNESTKVSDELYEVIKSSLEYAKSTEGKFDPTIGPLVEAWGINSDNARVPSVEEIDNYKPLIDYNLIEMNDEKKEIYLPNEGMILDLGAIAKGYAADKLQTHLVSKGIKHAIINLGGNIIIVGERFEENELGNKTWRIGIRDPQSKNSDDAIARIYVSDKTIVTSGIYEREFYDEKTKKYYHHILDPDTGYPVDNNLASVTIIADSSTDADALSTSVFSLGLEKGRQYVENIDGIDAIFINKDNEIYKTSGVDKLYNFELLKENVVNTDNIKDILLYGGLFAVILISSSFIILIATKKNKK